MVLLGLLLVSQAKDDRLWTGIGTSLTAAGLSGYIIFLYLLHSDRLTTLLSLFDSFGFAGAFAARAERIKSEYDSLLATASDRIDILGFGLSALREDYGAEFQTWKTHASIRILLLDPDFPDPTSSYALARDVEEENSPGKIATDAKLFVQQTRSLIDDRFQVRLYRCLPSVNIFRVDDRLFWGPYLMKKQSRNAPTFLVKAPGHLHRVFVNQFETIWKSDDLSRSIPQSWPA